MQKVVINQMLSKLVAAAQAKFTEKRESLNTLVVLDEAHRLAPRRIADGGDDGIILKNTLLDAIRTTRKFGLGWMFISQTLASLDREPPAADENVFFRLWPGVGAPSLMP